MVTKKEGREVRENWDQSTNQIFILNITVMMLIKTIK